MPVNEFDFDALNEYITSSRDQTLREIARQHGKKYIGSSSSMTSVLSHFHFLLSNWRPIDTKVLSQGFTDKLRSFTRISRAPAAIFLRYKDGVYAIDADKEFDSANILMNLGKSMEKLLTMPMEEFERYRKSNNNKFSQESAAPESYHYSTCGDFLMRAQLDAYDSRLPGSGMFDLKTRAVVSIRMDTKNFETGQGYQIKSRFGQFESFEKEFFDMIRAAFLKYSLQVRIGRMDGIFVAFHNIERIFGFQYVSLPELDETLHGQQDTTLGNAEFELSLVLWNKILNKATAQFPSQSLRFHFETRESQNAFMYVFAEPMTEEQIDEIQTRKRHEIEAFQKKLLHPELDKAAYEEAAKDAEAARKNVTTETEEESQGDDSTRSTTDQTTNATTDTPITTTPTETSTATSTSTTPPANAEYDTSSEADVGFLDGLNEEKERPRELFALSVAIRHKVNGQAVARPSNLTANDRWTVDYELGKFSSASRAWGVYEACQRRRSKELSEDEDDDPGEVDNPYHQKLRKLSEEGREWRKEMDAEDIEKGTIILSEGGGGGQ